jgi:hypothetical protein
MYWGVKTLGDGRAGSLKFGENNGGCYFVLYGCVRLSLAKFETVDSCENVDGIVVHQTLH